MPQDVGRYTFRRQRWAVLGCRARVFLQDVLEPGTNGFVRSTLRTFVRERKAFKVGNELPFRLQRIQNGQLLIRDSATGREVDLWAFGQTNAKAFSRFLFRETASNDTSDYSSDHAEATAAALTSQETRQ